MRLWRTANNYRTESFGNKLEGKYTFPYEINEQCDFYEFVHFFL
jgi:hypothetical protein